MQPVSRPDSRLHSHVAHFLDRGFGWRVIRAQLALAGALGVDFALSPDEFTAAELHPGQVTGYGPTLVEKLTSRWQAIPLSDGTLTWFEIDLRRPGAQPQGR